jgi:hypothetical protein
MCGALRRAVPLLLTLVAAAGCGRDRLPVPDAEVPYTTGKPLPRVFEAQGVRFDAPEGWSFGRGGPAPLVGASSSGSATIAIWRYPRSEPLPETDQQLDAAHDALAAAVRQRDDSFKEIGRRRTRIDGAPAIELVGDERVAGQPRRVRSTHVFAHGAEVVVDQYAAPPHWPAADRDVFRPLLRSLELDPPRG